MAKKSDYLHVKSQIESEMVDGNDGNHLNIFMSSQSGSTIEAKGTSSKMLSKDSVKSNIGRASCYVTRTRLQLSYILTKRHLHCRTEGVYIMKVLFNTNPINIFAYCETK